VLAKLQPQAAAAAGLHREPGRVVLQGVGNLWIGRLGQSDRYSPGERPEVVVKGVVLFDDDDHVVGQMFAAAAEIRPNQTGLGITCS
jgi:hypothetical protein